MAARRRCTRQQRNRNAMEIKKRKTRGGKGEVVVEVIDITQSDDEEQTQPEEVTIVYEEVAPTTTTGNGSDTADEDGEDLSRLKTIVYFDDSSVGLDVVLTFFLDCLSQPKIFCHQVFRPLREFIVEATGIRLDVPENWHWKMDHEDNKVYVDKGDGWMRDLKKRLKQKGRQSGGRRGGTEDVDEEEEEEDTVYWADFTPIEKKTSLGLVVWSWTPNPVSLPLLELYLKKCRDSYVPPKPKPEKRPRNSRRVSPSAPKRTTRASWKKQIEDPESTPEPKPEASEPVEEPVPEPEDNGLHEHIRDFAAAFDITKNSEAEERYRGDIEAREKRLRLNITEPAYDRNLNLMVAQNRSIPTILPYKSSKGQNSKSDRSSAGSDSDSRRSMTPSTVSSSSSSNSSDSDFKGPRRRKPPLPASKSTKPRNGIMNQIQKPSRHSPAVCPHCNKKLATRKALYRHIATLHGSKKPEYVQCVCQRKVRKECLAIHKTVCYAQRTMKK